MIRETYGTLWGFQTDSGIAFVPNILSTLEGFKGLELVLLRLASLRRLIRSRVCYCEMGGPSYDLLPT